VFVVAPRCRQLVDQLRSAPLQPAEKPDGGEKIDPTWEGRYGHACAAARYGVMAKPEPSTPPPQDEIDPREEYMRQRREHAERQVYRPRRDYLW
jgi:hypothetical protein